MVEYSEGEGAGSVPPVNRTGNQFPREHSGHRSFFVRTESSNSQCPMNVMEREFRVCATHDTSPGTDGCRSNPRLTLQRFA